MPYLLCFTSQGNILMKKSRFVFLGAAFLVVASLLAANECQAQQKDKGSNATQRERKSRQDRGRRGGRAGRAADNAPKVGAVAPDFTLKSLDGKSETTLSSFKGDKPVVLFFGSYT